MGNTIWVDVEGRPDDDVPPDHSIMLRLMDELDELSDRLKVAKLSEFVDYSVIEAEYADELEGLERPLDDENYPCDRWFDPGRPLEAVPRFTIGLRRTSRRYAGCPIVRETTGPRH